MPSRLQQIKDDYRRANGPLSVADIDEIQRRTWEAAIEEALNIVRNLGDDEGLAEIEDRLLRLKPKGGE
jgi:hypothetical protein